MITTNEKFTYKPFKVEHLEAKSGLRYTKFLIGDSKKANDGRWYRNGLYSFVIFDDLQWLTDGVMIKVAKINSIEKSVSNGRGDIYTIIGEVEPANEPVKKPNSTNEDAQKVEEKDSFYDIRQVKESTSTSGIGEFNILDDDIQF